MDRRDFLIGASFAMLGAAVETKLWAQTPADVRLEIAPLKLEIAPGKVVRTIAYNGAVPGPLIRWPEGKPITIDVVNRTDVPEIVHWHGLWIPSIEDGAAEEGSPMIPVNGQRRYRFTPQPAGLRWYHTHTFAGHDLKRGTYTGQFGCFYIEPKQEPGAYDQEIFLTLHDWNAYMGNHAVEYVNGQVHTQGLDNFWSLVKRTLRGTYVAVEPFHLDHYLDEQVFRFNNRATKDNPLNDADRFAMVMAQVAGKRLTYAQLTGKGTDSLHHSAAGTGQEEPF